MTTKIRTLIVDDEPMARERVLSLLKQQPDIEVVGECADGAQALSAIERLEPELVFLDVQIPVMSEARSEFTAAATLTRNARERAFLLARADACDCEH